MLTTVLANNDHWDGPGHWWPIFPLIWLAFIIFLVAMCGRFGRRRWHSGSYAGESRLAERFAAGEIDESEYRDRLAVLREKGK